MEAQDSQGPQETRKAHTHVRINHGWLATAEKRLLIWIAKRLPVWINADHLTALAVLSMAAVGVALAVAPQWPPALALAILALGFNWFGDSLDGTVARVRGHERPRFGFYVDHVLDMVGTSFLLAGLAASGYMTPIIALALLFAYVLVAAEVFLATAVRGEFRMSFLNFGPTELRIVLAIGIAMLDSHAWVRPFDLGPFRLFDIGGVIATAGLLLAFVTAAIRTTVFLYRAEPLPKASGQLADRIEGNRQTVGTQLRSW
jgi:archaetidylinositol phosphate synthase